MSHLYYSGSYRVLQSRWKTDGKKWHIKKWTLERLLDAVQKLVGHLENEGKLLSMIYFRLLRGNNEDRIVRIEAVQEFLILLFRRCRAAGD